MASKLHIPNSAWSTILLNDTRYFVLNNEILCQVFWIHYWKHVLYDAYKNQNVIQKFKFNVKQPVYLSTKDLSLQFLPMEIKKILYYGGTNSGENKPQLSIPVTINVVFASYIIFCILYIWYKELVRSNKISPFKPLSVVVDV